MTKYYDLPHKIEGFSITDGYDDTTILNSRCSSEQNLQTCIHEDDHFQNNDHFREDMEADEIEAIRHGEQD